MNDVHVLTTGHPDMDYGEHERTYRFFIKLIKYGSIVVTLLLIFMAWLWV
jgi:hypothetical protein